MTGNQVGHMTSNQEMVEPTTGNHRSYDRKSGRPYDRESGRSYDRKSGRSYDRSESGQVI